MTSANTSYTPPPTMKLMGAFFFGGARHIGSEATSVRNGGWQRSLGDDLAEKTLGVIGLGNIGSGVAQVGLAFGMNVVACRQNLTASVASAAGPRLVSKAELLRTPDVVSTHIVF